MKTHHLLVSCPAILILDFLNALLLQVIFQSKIVGHREAEYSRLKNEREERINQHVTMRKRDREIKRKLLFYLKSEEERLTKLQEEEEARKREGTVVNMSRKT